MPTRTFFLLPFVFFLCLFPTFGHAFCFAEAASRFSEYGVDKSLLEAIARVESGLNASAINKNANGTEDIGVMQINTSWLPSLKRFGIRRRDLLDPCVNVHVGAWVLAQNLYKFGPTWRAIGAYNARSEEKMNLYVSKVWRQLNGPDKFDPPKKSRRDSARDTSVRKTGGLTPSQTNLGY